MGEQSGRRSVSSGAPWEGQVGYSRAVRIGNVIAVSGTTAVGEDGKVIGHKDAFLQARRCFEIIGAALNQAGSGLQDVIRTRMYVVDIERDWKEVARAHSEVFGAIRPAATMVEVAGLIDPVMLVEIEVDAVVGGAPV